MASRTNRIFAICALALAGSVALPAPAFAVNWISIGGGSWIDRDSISRNGDWAFFKYDWADEGHAPDTNTSGVPKFYNCATHHTGNVVNGQVDDGPGFGGSIELDSNEASIYSRILCS